MTRRRLSLALLLLLLIPALLEPEDKEVEDSDDHQQGNQTGSHPAGCGGVRISGEKCKIHVFYTSKKFQPSLYNLLGLVARL